MAIDARKHVAPAAGETPRRQVINDLSLSVRDPIPVANTTERAQLVTALTAVGQAPSATNPLFVYRADAPAGARLEMTQDGTTWQISGRPIVHGPTALVGAVPAGATAWGYENAQSVNGHASGKSAITWPAFPNAIVNVQVSMLYPGTTTGAMVVQYADVTLSGCNLVYSGYSGGIATTGTYVTSISVTGA
jgi:hypothetical protein